LRPTGSAARATQLASVFAWRQTLLALRGSTLVSWPVDHPDQRTETAIKIDNDTPSMLIGFAQGQVAVVTQHRRVASVDPGNGTSKLASEAQDDRELARLLAAAHTCKGDVVYAEDQVNANLARRADLFIRSATHAMARVLTDKLPGIYHEQPSFSPDCHRVAFVSDAQ
jgi:hypothetical protein